MATTNPVSQVLVTSGDQGLLAAGNPVSALAVGQLGIFNFHTGLSIDGSNLALANDVFLAVGLDPLGTGGLSDVAFSAGQMIQASRFPPKSLTFKGYVATLPKIIDLGGFKAKCETDYAVKIEFRNGQTYVENGYNQFTKTFNYQTGCCADQCEPCGDGNCVELAKGLVANVNADPDKLATASYFVYALLATVNTAPTADANTTLTIGTYTIDVAVLDADTAEQAAAKIVAAVNADADAPYVASVAGAVMTFYPKGTPTNNALVPAVAGAGVTVNATSTSKTLLADDAALDAFLATDANLAEVCPGIRFTSNPMAVKAFVDINLGYEKVRATDMIISLPTGFTCNGTVTTVQELRYTEGSGYDIKQQEYVAGGWNGKPGPYRQSTLTGLARQGFQYNASASATYNQFVLTYDQFSVGGWLEYLNNLETVIAVPCADATTMAAIATAFDLIFPKFQIASDVTANGDCTNTSTNAINNYANDGIESMG